MDKVSKSRPQGFLLDIKPIYRETEGKEGSKKAKRIHSLHQTHYTSPDSVQWHLIMLPSPYAQEDFYEIQASFDLQEIPTEDLMFFKKKKFKTFRGMKKETESHHNHKIKTGKKT